MSDNASPRPWKIIGKDNQIVSADGKVMVPNTGYRENAELIVEAVNCHDWLKEHNRLNAEEVCKLIGERDRLRDIVRRLAKRLSSRTLAVVCTPGTRGDETAPDYDLIDEARAAIGEDAP